MKKFTAFIKSAGISVWLCIAAVLLGLAGTIIFAVTNGTVGYPVANGALGIVLGFAAAVVLAVSLWMSAKFGSASLAVASSRLVALVLFFLDIAFLVISRAELASALFTWDSHNQVGWDTLYVSIAGVAMYILSSLCLIVGAFLGNDCKGRESAG